MATAQADYRANDRDGNGVHDFWRKDVAGLYTLVHRNDRGPNPEPIKLIELSIAAADDRPATDVSVYSNRSAKAGYWFQALRFEDEDPRNPDPNRFAACAFPDNRHAGRWTFIISHANTVYKKDLGARRRGVLVYPADPLRNGWIRMD